MEASQQERDKQPDPGWWEIPSTGEKSSRPKAEQEVRQPHPPGRGWGWQLGLGDRSEVKGEREEVQQAGYCQGRRGGILGWCRLGGLFPPWEGEWQEEGRDPGHTEGPVLVWVEV